MKPSVEILVTNLSEFNLIEWDKSPLFNNYQRLINYISANIGTEYANFFAIPKIANADVRNLIVKWYSGEVGNNPKPLSSLEGEEFTLYKNIYTKKVEVITSLIDKIEKSGKDKRWANMLRNALETGGDDYIFCGNGTVIIAAWSMKPATKEANILFGKDVSKDKLSTEGSENEVAQDVQNQDINSQGTENEEEDALKSETEHISTDNTADDEKEDEDKTENEEDDLTDQYSEDSAKNTTVKTDKKYKKYWFYLLLLLFLLLLVFLFKKCQSVKVLPSPLPERPGEIIPVDPIDIAPSPDSLANIVVDRLNIVLRGENKNLEAFALDFKKVYPKDVYQIIYYDTLTSRLQIQIPKEEREKVKEELKGLLPEYQLLIWHESVFQRNTIPNDPDFSDKRKSWYFDVIKAPGGWNTTFGDNDVIVAIIDNGFDLTHPELKEHVYKPYNVCERSADVLTNAKAKHGTHVAGTALGAKDNGSGLAGIAPGCRFMPIQVSDRNDVMTQTAIIDAILYAINQGADVINLSLGMSMPAAISLYPVSVQRDIITTSFLSEEDFWNDIFDIAEENNTTIVMAAGNQNILVGLDPMQRNTKGIKVNAVDQNLSKAGFSNFGERSTISAPGVQIYSSTPGNRYEYMQGTSMASPIVAGGVALLKSINKNLNTQDIIDLLVYTGQPLYSSSGQIGNLIQLDQAVERLRDGNFPMLPPPNDDCDNIQTKIDSLQSEIDRLRSQCPETSLPPQDTMKIPEKIDDFSFSVGRWKSTTSLHNNDGEEVTIYFDFRADQSGIITLVEPDNKECTATLNLSAQNSTLKIHQNAEAICNPPPGGYNAYDFECKPDADGYAACVAQNRKIRANRFTFRLIKIK